MNFFLRLKEHFTAKLQNELMVLKSLGVVYGDIGTSPIYTLAIALLVVKPSTLSIYELLSLVLWTLTLLVTVQYAWLATSLSKRGEGGTVVLLQLLLPHLKSIRSIAVISALGYVGISLLIGDGVITPAISILSAVEGIKLIPEFANTSKITLLLLAGGIAFALFAVQKKGIEKVASAFAPVMILWFFTLALGGGYFIVQEPSVLKAVSPYYAIDFILHHPWIAFMVLGDILLCATGGEAIYADMGHMGRLPIVKGWLFVSFSLILSYFGQGAFLVLHPHDGTNPFFLMYHTLMPSLYIVILLLAVMATIIASQAMISGIFSVLYQAMTTRIFPHFSVDYTSTELRNQIYVGSINWFLFFCVVAMLFIFQSSDKLAQAYGLSVAGAMSVSGILMTLIFFKKQNYYKMVVAILTGSVSFLFFASCWLKIPNGGFWSLLIAAIPLFTIVLYTKGQKKLYQALVPYKMEQFLEEYLRDYTLKEHIEGTALFFARTINIVPVYISKTMFQNGIMYDYNVIVTIHIPNEPYGITSELRPLAEGLDLLVIEAGYMENLNIQTILRDKNIKERTIFYGDEEIVSENMFWRVFASIKNLAPSFVNFYKFPDDKLVGVAYRTEI